MIYEAVHGRRACSKEPLSHPPNPGAPRRAVSAGKAASCDEGRGVHAYRKGVTVASSEQWRKSQLGNWSLKMDGWFNDKVFKPLEDKKMPIMEHLHELQIRLTRAVIVIAFAFIGTFFYADTLVYWLKVPLQNYFIPDAFEWVPSDLPKIPFVFLSPAEALWQNLKVAALCAVVLTTPYTLWESWQFFVPGLHAQERRFVGPFTAITIVAFYLGLSFCFFIVLPFALHFLISYGLDSGFIPQISIANYVGFALWFMLVFGLVFEVPLALTLMAKLGGSMRRY